MQDKNTRNFKKINKLFGKMCYFADLFGKIGGFLAMRLCAGLVFLQVVMRLTCNIEPFLGICGCRSPLSFAAMYSFIGTALIGRGGRRLSRTFFAHAFF